MEPPKSRRAALSWSPDQSSRLPGTVVTGFRSRKTSMKISDVNVSSVRAYRELVHDLLARAVQVKQAGQADVPLSEANLGDTIWRVRGEQDGIGMKEQAQQAHYAAVETAFREKFCELLATTSIDHPSFTQIWDLLDIVSIFSDNEQCEPGLIFWLIEELLDSQTIDGCRKVFDYLESRRERITAKHFKQKNLIILRSCNELLRRLSRAEDTVFCGRVFIYLFQSFPLGDKSSVNLRGEYHSDNVTIFDAIFPPQDPEEVTTQAETSVQAQSYTGNNSRDTKQGAINSGAATPSDKKAAGEQRINLEVLYPIFWGLQAYFSNPTKLFEHHHFAAFKTGLEATVSTFIMINTDHDSRGGTKGSEEVRRGTKRRRTGDGVEIMSSFNPKYLTSRELFYLEVHDIAFRRHILVQALIILNFVLSLTPKAREKFSDLTNKSVLYSYIVNEDDAKWATEIRGKIADYLQQGVGGKFYYRMVDTVLSRDKNWVRWKAEGCPLIERPSVSVTDYVTAQETSVKVFASKRLRPSPLNSLDLTFLSEGQDTGSLERLKEPDRFATPTPSSFMMGIDDDDFSIDLAKTKEERENATQTKASKVWRTLRLTCRTKLGQFDKIDDGKNIRALFENSQPREESESR